MDNQIPKPDIDQGVYERYLAGLLKGDRAECAAVVQERMAAGVRLQSLYVDLFQRGLYAVGELWERQKISVAVEHLATAITQRMLTLVQPQAFSGAARDRTIIISCVTDECHQIGGRMIADLAELRGWRGHFLGARTRLPDLLRLIEEKRPQLVGLSMGIYFNRPALVKTIDEIERAYPDLEVLVGGQAFRWGGLEAVQDRPGVSYVASLEEFEQRMAAYE